MIKITRKGLMPKIDYQKCSLTVNFKNGGKLYINGETAIDDTRFSVEGVRSDWTIPIKEMKDIKLEQKGRDANSQMRFNFESGSAYISFKNEIKLV